MPTIYDNIDNILVDALKQILIKSEAADCCVGYFNLRGWGQLSDIVAERFGGGDNKCVRVLVGMHRPPVETMRLAQSAIRQDEVIDGPTLAKLRRQASESFKEQLEFGIPTTQAEIALRHLATQLREKRVIVKLFLRYPLHAKLYLAYRDDPIAPKVGYLGSSNLTLAGLLRQGELNIDVLDQDATNKLQEWFNDRWEDDFSIDITDELINLIENSWAREDLVDPYLVYLKMIFHLAEDAREGEKEFKLPKDFEGVLIDFQEKAVSLTARHLHKRGGVLLGDVVGLGKSIMATAVARIFQDDDNANTLIICPPNLQEMWQNEYVDKFRLAARVVSIGKTINLLPDLPRFKLVIIDESHNLRNREGKRYRAIHEYIERNDSLCMMLTATPYNKQYTDLSNQLRLFMDEGQELGIRPEMYFQQWGSEGHTESDFIARFQTSPRSLAGFEKSEFADDWRDLMRLFLVRRTRSFIIENYAQYDPQRDRYFVMLGKQPYYFPIRKPKTLLYDLDENDPTDQYARLYREECAQLIENLNLPRYGLANYLQNNAESLASKEEKRILQNLNRAGKRLIGFCRTNLFKRLESSGHSFILSVERHILRNMITCHALENDLPIPIGTQNASLLDTSISDEDVEITGTDEDYFEEDLPDWKEPLDYGSISLSDFQSSAEDIYEQYRDQYSKRFDWLPGNYFKPNLSKKLYSDAEALVSLLNLADKWDPDKDSKLNTLIHLLTQIHPHEKILVFSQFSDTVDYLVECLKYKGIERIESVTGDSSNPNQLIKRFSPVSNSYVIKPYETELRILVATDILAEGHNLQDASIVVNFDLPWAIIRLIQRAGRVDRIGQEQDTILVYSFMPADGVERVIGLRARLSYRLQQNQEVIGTDEIYFDDQAVGKMRDLYTENASVLTDDEDEDVDLSSAALQVWNSAPEDARKKAESLPPVIYATRPHDPDSDNPEGVLSYLRFPDGMDMLVRVNIEGNVISQSMSGILRVAVCTPETPAIERLENHHELTSIAVEKAITEVTNLGGQLGSRRTVRRKLYERLQIYRNQLLLLGEDTTVLERVMDVIFKTPLRESARDSLSRQMRLGVGDEDLAAMIITRYEEERLVKEILEEQVLEPQVVCTMGLRKLLEEESFDD